MVRLAPAAVLAALASTAACRISLDDETQTVIPTDGGTDGAVSAACQEATTYQDLATIEAKIFKQSCVFSGCHNGESTDAGRLDYRAGKSFASLVGATSEVADGRTIVVPGDPKASYLMLMLGQVPPAEASPPGVAPPADIGYMPQGTGGSLLCQQKRDAIERWIMAGAAND